MTSGGYGRGGRGAALFEALKAPARKPGAQANGAGRGSVEAEGGAASRPPPSSIDRGEYLATLLQSSKISEKGDAGGGYKPKPVTGRGAMLAQMVSHPSSPSTSMPSPASTSSAMQVLLGRGRALSSDGSIASPARSVGSSQAAPSVASVASGGRSTPVESESSSRRSGRQPPVSGDRPAVIKHGKDGKPISLSANYIRMKSHIQHILMYAVSYSPEIDNKQLRRRLLYEHSDVLGPIKSFTGTTLFVPQKLDSEITFQSVRPTDGQTVTITLKLVRNLPPEECVGVFNVVLKRIMYILNMKQVGRHYYDPWNPASVPQHKLEVWPGYITAIKRHEGGLLLLTDVSHKVIRTETVLGILYMISQRNRNTYQEEAIKALVGVSILTRYNNKTYRIDDIKWDMNPTHTFSSSKDGQQISFIDYYAKAHNKEIKDFQQPLLIHRPKKREMGASKLDMICLIPELCYMTGLTDDMRSDFRVMKDLAQHTRVTPNQRQLALRKFIHNVNSNEEASNMLRGWGLSFDTDTIPLDGRHIDNEKIQFRDRQIVANNEADWGRDLTRNNVIMPVDLRCWMLMFVQRDRQRATDFARNMSQVAPAMGIQVYDPMIFELPNDRTDTYLTHIRTNLNPQVQCVVTIFPTSRDDRYNAVKKLCYVESPVASQVINSKTLDPKKIRSVTQKIALQINAKLGGELWAVPIPKKGLMVIGIDSYHDKGGGQSVGGIVASINPRITRWYSRVCHQHQGQELVDGLKPCFLGALKKYQQVNNALPTDIVVFRDGVGDGQLAIVGDHEVSQLATSYKHFGETYEPKMSFVIVQKGINTRIFLNKGNQLDNPPPGTVVDHTIVRRDLYDFFLVSQHVRQGTVTPTHYVVAYGGDNLPVDRMQKLTYKLTHMYYNWPGTVRVPAPCQYAHKLAYLVGQNLKKDPHLDLSDRLFFL